MTRAIDARIATLEAQGAQHYDPFRFRYIKSLLARSASKPKKVAAFAEKKASECLLSYEKELKHARSKAEQTLESIRRLLPNAAKKAQRLFENYEYKKVDRLHRRLQHRRAGSPVSELIDRLGASQEMESDSERLDLDNNYGLLKAATESSSFTTPAELVSSANRPKPGLRSLRLFEGTMKTLHSNRVVTRAIHDRPENPGPLNTQMLATRSLSALRQLSPEYLARFVSYIDTLLLLQDRDE